MNKTLTSWLSVVVVFLCLPLYAWNGSGTYEDPYEINTASDVADLVVAVNGGADQSGVYFLQTADIDLSPFDSVPGFPGIGTPSAPFSGFYDGDGYRITELNISTFSSGTGTNAYGFFGYCQNATIENVSVYGDISVSVDYNLDSCVGVGGVIGITKRGLFSGCKNYCRVAFSLSNAPNESDKTLIKYAAGGVVGLEYVASSTSDIGNENHGDVSFYGMNGACSAAGVVSCENSSLVSYTLKDSNNYGRIVAEGHSNAFDADAEAAGVLVRHQNVPPASWTFSYARGCSNWGDVFATGAVHTCGVAISSTKAYGTQSLSTNNCTNYGNINVCLVSSHCSVAGVACETGTYKEPNFDYCVNFGKVSLTGRGSTPSDVGGVVVSMAAQPNEIYYAYQTWESLANYGEISVDLSNGSVICGGVACSPSSPVSIAKASSLGKIKIKTAGSGRVGGVASTGSTASRQLVVRDTFFASAIDISPASYSVAGLLDNSDYAYASAGISNSYFLGSVTGVASYPALASHLKSAEGKNVSAFGCYALVNDGNPLFGSINAPAVMNVSDCFAIGGGSVFGTIVDESGLTTNNLATISYEEAYHNPPITQGFLYDYAFTAADKTTNYFDLILPINKTLFPVQTDAIISLHNWTKAQGYKRYIRTIQQ